MVYLLLGEDEEQRQAKISELKKKHVTSSDAEKFDYEILHGHKLEASILKRALTALPAIAKKRFLLLRQCHKLSSQNKDLIAEFVTTQPEHAVLVMESPELSGSDRFVKKIKSDVKVVDFSRREKTNVFDMTRAMSVSGAQALKMLSGLLAEGVHPLQIMGALVWFWKKSQSRLSAERFEEGLLALQEADLNIKRSRLKPDYTMEVLVVKLCALLK